MYNQDSGERMVITISKITIPQDETKPFFVEGNGQKFSFFKEGMKGVSKAFVTFQSFREGDVVSVFYKTKGQYKNALGFYTPKAGETQTHPAPQAHPAPQTNQEGTYRAPATAAPSHSGHYNTPTTGRQDVLGRRLGVHGFINGQLASGVAPANVDVQAVIDLEDRLTAALEKAVMGPVGTTLTEQLPIINQDEEINVEGIPFK